MENNLEELEASLTDAIGWLDYEMDRGVIPWSELHEAMLKKKEQLAAVRVILAGGDYAAVR